MANHHKKSKRVQEQKDALLALQREDEAADAQITQDVTLPDMGNVTKSYDDEYAAPIPYNATSFGELETLREAEVAARKATSLASDLQGIISNIMWDDEIADKPSAIQSAVKEFADRYTPTQKNLLERIWDGVLELKEKLAGKNKPPESDFESLRVYKDADGNFRWLGIASNNFMDLDGEIITEAAHKEFMEFLDANPDQAPLYVSWHILGTARKSRADFWDTHAGFVIFGGPLTEAEAEVVLRAKEQYDLGMSHGFYVLRTDPHNPKHIIQYRSFEVSELPVDRAANPWTSLDVLSKEVTVNKKKLDYLQTLYGKDVAEALVKGLDAQAKALTALGVARKETVLEEPPAAPAEPAAPVAETPAETPAPEAEKPEGTEPEAPADDKTPAVPDAEALVKALGLPELSAYLKGMEDRQAAMQKELTALKQSNDEKLAEQIAPAFTPLVWKERASQSAETVVDQKDVPPLPQGPEEWMKNIVPLEAQK